MIRVQFINCAFKYAAGCEPRTCPSEGFQGKDCKCWCKGNPLKECNETKMNIIDNVFGMSDYFIWVFFYQGKFLSLS